MAYGGFLPVYTETGAPPVVQSFPVKAGQTIKRGYPVKVYMDGTITATAIPGAVMTALATSTSIMGIAAEPVTTTATESTARVLVWVATDNTIFEGKNTGTGRPEKWIGDRVDFEIQTSSNFRINEDAGTPKVLKIVGVHPSDISGTASGKRLWFKIAAAASQYDGLEVS
jgi:hypothetical protein